LAKGCLGQVARSGRRPPPPPHGVPRLDFYRLLDEFF